MKTIHSILIAAALMLFGSSAFALPPQQPIGSGASCFQYATMKCEQQSHESPAACSAAASKQCAVLYPQSTPCSVNCGSTGMDFGTAKAIDYVWYAICQVEIGLFLGEVTSGLAAIVGSAQLAGALISEGKQYASPCGFVGTKLLAQTYAQFNVPNPPTLP